MKPCKCPCKECISLAMCLHREELVCSIVSSWYLKYYPYYTTLLRHQLEIVYGYNISTIITEDRRTDIQFNHKRLIKARRRQ